MSNQDIPVVSACEESRPGGEGEDTDKKRYTQNTEKGVGAVGVYRATEIRTGSSSTDPCLVKRCARDTENECPPPKRHQDCSIGHYLPVHSGRDLPVHPQPQSLSQRLLDLEQRMCQELATLHFSSPVTHIYNPLSYAAEPHCCYVHSYANSTKRILFFGMNPGPFGMAQTGVPFSDASIATGWLGVSGRVGKPPVEHPKRPIVGLSCSRHEVSGSRFWGLYQDLCGKPETFFTNCFVHNYCPLCFMGPTGKNVTPPQLKVAERNALQDICDRYLLLVVRLLEVEWLIGVGKYAENRAKKALQSFERDVKIASITHPSPINPAANKDWKGLAKSQLAALGLLDIVSGRVKQEEHGEHGEPVATTFSVERKTAMTSHCET